MNDRQRIVVAIGATLVLLSGLFLPYEGLATSRGQDLGSRYLGYHCVFSPPTPQYVYKAIAGREWSRGDDASLAAYHARIVVSQVLISVVVLMIATLGAVMVLGIKRCHPEPAAIDPTLGQSPQAPCTIPGAQHGIAESGATIYAPAAHAVHGEVLNRTRNDRYFSNHVNAIGTVCCFGIAAIIAVVATTTSWSIPRGVALQLDGGAPSAVGLRSISFWTGLQLAWHLVTAAFFLKWFHRAYLNLTAIGASARRHEPGWAIGAFFVPFVNFVLPFLIAREIWQGSHAARLRKRPASNPAAQGIVPLWWISFLIAVLLDRLGSGYLRRATDSEVLAAGSNILLAANVVTAISAVLALIFVLEVEHSQSVAK